MVWGLLPSLPGNRMRGLTPTEYWVLAITTQTAPPPKRPPTTEEIIAAQRLLMHGRARLVPQSPYAVVTPAGREAMRIYELLTSWGAT